MVCCWIDGNGRINVRWMDGLINRILAYTTTDIVLANLCMQAGMIGISRVYIINQINQINNRLLRQPLDRSLLGQGVMLVNVPSSVSSRPTPPEGRQIGTYFASHG